MRDIGQFLSVPLGFQRSLRPSLALPDRSTLSQAIDKHSFLHAASSAAERISFPLYLTCSSGSQQTVKGHKTAGRKACKYLNHYLSEGPDLSFTARTGCNLPARPVPSPQTAQSHTHICMQTDGLRGAAEKSEKCKCNCTQEPGDNISSRKVRAQICSVRKLENKYFTSNTERDSSLSHR